MCMYLNFQQVSSVEIKVHKHVPKTVEIRLLVSEKNNVQNIEYMQGKSINRYLLRLHSIPIPMDVLVPQ